VAQPASLAHFGQPTRAPLPLSFSPLGPPRQPSLSWASSAAAQLPVFPPPAHRANPPARARVQLSSAAAQPQLPPARAKQPKPSQRRAQAARSAALSAPLLRSLAWSAQCRRRSSRARTSVACALCFFQIRTPERISREENRPRAVFFASCARFLPPVVQFPRHERPRPPAQFSPLPLRLADPPPEPRLAPALCVPVAGVPRPAAAVVVRNAKVSLPHPLSPFPFFLPRRTRLLRTRSPPSRRLTSPARPRAVAARRRGQGDLRSDSSLPRTPLRPARSPAPLCATELPPVAACSAQQARSTDVQTPRALVSSRRAAAE
jgi:hypothetical protein